MHAGYLSHNGKHQRIAAICKQLQLPAPMPKVKTLMQLQVQKDHPLKKYMLSKPHCITIFKIAMPEKSIFWVGEFMLCINLKRSLKCSYTT